MSPLLFAKDISIQMQETYNRLARVRFEDEKIHQRYEDGGLTGHDTLILGNQYNNDLFLSLWIDIGVGGIPVAMSFQADKEVTITPIYEQTQLAKKLTIEEIQQVFNYVFDNPHVIEIKAEKEG